MIGIEERDTESGIHVVRLHYSADPAKRTEEWIQEARRGLSDRAFRKEYEICWSVASGLPVYADEFVREWHVAKQELLAVPELTVYRGWDMGPTHVSPACTWGQLDSCGRLLCLHELVTWTGRGDVRSMDIPQFVELVVLESNQLFDGCDFTDYCDPAGWTKSMTDARSAIDIMRGMGVHPRRGPVTFTDRKRAITDRLTRSIAGAPAMIFSPTCTMMIEGMDGAYKYEEIGETGRYKPIVDKNAWSHVVNSWEYVVGGLYRPRRDRDVDEDDRPRRIKHDPVTGY